MAHSFEPSQSKQLFIKFVHPAKRANDVNLVTEVLIDGCGRTDFQCGSAAALYDSITGKLFALPDTNLVWPAHDHNGARYRPGWERKHNSRLTNRDKEGFVELMSNGPG